MDLRLVGYFVAVIEHGGITKAAEALYIAQPSLSQAVRTLEKQLGVQLFDRSGRVLTLTPDGEAFASPARRILADAEHARSRVRSVQDLESGRLEIAALPTLAVDPLPELTARLHRRHPNIRVTVSDPGSAPGVTGMVRKGRAELGLTELPLEGGNLRTHELWEREITIALPPSLAAGLPDPVPLDAIRDIPVVLEFSGSSGRAFIDDTLNEAIGNVAVECAHRQTIWHLVEHGAGATFLPRSIAERELSGVIVRSISPEIRRIICLVSRPPPLSPAATALLEVVEIMRAERAGKPAQETHAPREKAQQGRRSGRTSD